MAMTNSNEPTTLRDVALAAIEKLGLTGGGRPLDRAAKKAGVNLSYTTVDRIIAGTYNSRPGAATLDALATLSGITREKVYEVAGEPLPLSPFAEVLPPDADLLTAPQRQAVLEVVRQMAESNRSLFYAERARKDGEGRAERPATKTPAGGSPATTKDDVDLAAYEKTGPTRLEQLRAAQDADAEGSQD